MTEPVCSQGKTVVDDLYSGKATVPKAKIRKMFAKMYKTIPKVVFIFGFRTHLTTTGFFVA
uniref:Small ribosomal subunit protein eS24 n=1 Tax=Oryzias melastigma TaxID=30732 RepID=A0A3B3C7H8_ORYME